MLTTFSLSHIIYLIIAIGLEVIANILLKLAHSSKRKLYIVAAIFFVLASFTFLSFAIKGIPLSIAYSIWGGCGLIIIAILGIFMFKEKIKPIGWFGISCIILGISLIKLA